MQNMIESILSNIEVITEVNLKKYEARLDTIKNAYSEANNHLQPNIDKRNRLHAPCNGYVIPEGLVRFSDLTGDDMEKMNKTAKGAYLPDPIEKEDGFEYYYSKNKKKVFKHKTSFIANRSEMISLLRNIETKGKPFFLTFSREWDFKDDKSCWVSVSGVWNSVCSEFFESFKLYNQNLAMAEKIKNEELLREKKAQKGNIVEGKRLEITGTIIGLRTVDGFAYNTVEHKMTLELENKSTVYGRIPKSIIESEKGDKVTFFANISSSDDDPTHGYFKNPTKAKILA